jgi:hypothetical protein
MIDHYVTTLSPLAQRLLENWQEELPNFLRFYRGIPPSITEIRRRTIN